MTIDELTEIGTIKRAHGLHGAFKATIDSFYIEQLRSLDALILKKEDSFLPFFIEKMDITTTQTIIKFESFSNKEEVTPFNGKSLYVPTKQLSEVKESTHHQLLGKRLTNQQGELIGEIIEVSEMPTQLLLTVQEGEREFFIPYHEDMLIEQSDKAICLSIPDGLIDLY